MKNALVCLTISILFINFNVVAQDNAESQFRVNRNEFSFGLIGGGELSQNGITAMPSIGYKRFVKDGAFRVITGGTISTSSDSWSNQSDASASLRIGYQYHVMLGRFMPMLGMDIMGGYSKYEYGYAQNNQSTEISLTGLSPNLGLEFWISPKLSVFMDIRFDVTYRQMVNEYNSFDEWSGTSVYNKTTASGINTHVSPISSFQAAFHF